MELSINQKNNEIILVLSLITYNHKTIILMDWMNMTQMMMIKVKVKVKVVTNMYTYQRVKDHILIITGQGKDLNDNQKKRYNF